jgi:hypothetical protein
MGQFGCSICGAWWDDNLGVTCPNEANHPKPAEDVKSKVQKLLDSGNFGIVGLGYDDEMGYCIGTGYDSLESLEGWTTEEKVALADGMIHAWQTYKVWLTMPPPTAENATVVSLEETMSEEKVSIGSETIACETCGYEFEETVAMVQGAPDWYFVDDAGNRDESVVCPKCGSTKIHLDEY